MLILPLHRPMSRANFPLATAVLILLNVFVFFVLQDRDDVALDLAQQHYASAELGRYEVPAYERYLRDAHRDEELAALRAVPEPARAAYVAGETLTDVLFLDRLGRGELFEQATDFEAWKPLRARYDELQSDVFTLRHMLRSSEVDPWRMLAAAFLHGNFLHLLGNMIFLAILGPLVEGALGGWRYTALYLLSALGSSAASLAWRWGEAGGGLGASGAIAALMGAFCVLWGRQPVRFFYWFGVVFDYVRKPAIWLLPVWLGWEVYHLLFHGDMGIGFDAHAGGIVSGALLGGVMVALNQVRQDYIRDADDDTQRDDRWERAQAHLGRMQLREAEALLNDLVLEQPNRFDFRLAHYHVARNAGQPEKLPERRLALLRLSPPDAAGAAQQVEAVARMGDVGTLPIELRQELARRWLGREEFDAVERLLSAPDAGPEFVQLWLLLGLKRRDVGDTDAFRRVMTQIIERFPNEPQAQKAKFLLENA